VRGGPVPLPRGHPLFLLPRQGEETEEERENNQRDLANGDTTQKNRLPHSPPRSSILGGEGEQNLHASISEPIRERHERREVRVPGVAFAR